MSACRGRPLLVLSTACPTPNRIYSGDGHADAFHTPPTWSWSWALIQLLIAPSGRTGRSPISRGQFPISSTFPRSCMWGAIHHIIWKHYFLCDLSVPPCLGRGGAIAKFVLRKIWSSELFRIPPSLGRGGALAKPARSTGLRRSFQSWRSDFAFP